MHVEQRDEREYAQHDLVRARVGLLSARFVRARDLIAAPQDDRDRDGSIDAHVEQDHARRVREKDHHERVNLARVFVEQTQIDIEIYLKKKIIKFCLFSFYFYLFLIFLCL